MPTDTNATLHLLCGKIAAGKSTLAARLAQSDQTVLLAEDTWLNALFADQLETPADYLRCSAKLRAVVGPHVAALLNAGLSVVLDFPANTAEQRAWMLGILQASKADHQLHVLTPPDAVCLARLHKRNSDGEHPFSATEEQFLQFSKHFVAPTPQEGFNIVLHNSDGT